MKFFRQMNDHTFVPSMCTRKKFLEYNGTQSLSSLGIRTHVMCIHLCALIVCVKCPLRYGAVLLPANRSANINHKIGQTAAFCKRFLYVYRIDWKTIFQKKYFQANMPRLIHVCTSNWTLLNAMTAVIRSPPWKCFFSKRIQSCFTAYIYTQFCFDIITY